MQVTDVRLNLLNTDNGVKAIGSFSLDDEFAIRGIRVMEDKHGRNFVAFPSRQKADGTYEDVAFPLSKELYAEVTEAIINEYNEKVEKRAEKEQSKEKDESPIKEDEQPKEAEVADETASKKKGR